MKKTFLTIGIVGCGAIGESLALSIADDFRNSARLTGLYDLDVSKSQRLSLTIAKNQSLVASSLDSLILRSDLVIECSSARASWPIAREVLASKKNIMIMSVGGILAHAQEIIALAASSRACVYIPSGAIAGIDALKAASFATLRKVTLTTSKNPHSFKGVEYLRRKGIDVSRIKKNTILFKGSAARAVAYFPQNINVAATLSIAGIGKEKTVVVIRAVPGLRRNIHEIKIESDAGSIFTRTENVPHPQNQKTSYLAVLSAKAMLARILGRLTIGT